MAIARRSFLLSVALAAAATAPGLRSARAAPAAKLKLGYLHGLASDSHLWVAHHLGAFAQQGLEIEPIQFVSGLEAYQALVGGGVDLVTTGAVIANFPARGQGKAFLLNATETATAQLWVQPSAGVNSVADLKGKKIVTARGTTAHYFLHRALQTVGLDSTRDVEIIHQPMGNAVATFVSGAASIVATWVPFDTVIAKGAPQAVKLIDAGQVPNSAILNGWSARNALFAEQPELLKRFIRAWRVANDLLADKPAEALDILQRTKWPEYALDELRRQYDLAQWRKTADWAQAIRAGDPTRQLDQVTQFNVAVGAFKDPLPAAQYFDPSLFLSVAAEA